MSWFNTGHKAVNSFFSTALGKSVQTLLWTVASYAAALGLATLAKVHWSDQMLALGVPGLINWTAYSVKVLLDKEVPTLPSSTPMQLVPAVPTEPEVVQPTVTNNVNK